MTLLFGESKYRRTEYKTIGEHVMSKSKFEEALQEVGDASHEAFVMKLVLDAEARLKSRRTWKIGLVAAVLVFITGMVGLKWIDVVIEPAVTRIVGGQKEVIEKIGDEAVSAAAAAHTQATEAHKNAVDAVAAIEKTKKLLAVLQDVDFDKLRDNVQKILDITDEDKVDLFNEIKTLQQLSVLHGEEPASVKVICGRVDDDEGNRMQGTGFTSKKLKGGIYEITLEIDKDDLMASPFVAITAHTGAPVPFKSPVVHFFKNKNRFWVDMHTPAAFDFIAVCLRKEQPERSPKMTQS